jgi:predicted permease
MPPAIVAVLGVMLVAVFGVLLIACFNVANLLLARSAARTREVAVRSALGAGRGRIIRQFLIEAGVLSVLGGLLGIVVAYVGIEAFNAAIIDVERPYWIDVRMDGPVLAFSFAVMAFAGIAAGTLPAVRATGGKLNEILQDESRGSSSFRMGRLSGVLVVGELALSCALLVAAGMMVKSIVNVATYDLGFDEEGIFTGRVALAPADYPDDDSQKRFYEELLRRLESDPSVESVALTTTLPAVGAPTARIALEDAEYSDERDRPVSNYAQVTAGYFDVLGVDPVAGRLFEEQDRLGTVPVAVVNESFALRHFGDAPPLGRRFRVGQRSEFLTIVGVIPDIYVGGGGPGGIGADQVLPEQFFQPLYQAEDVRFVSVAAKTHGDPGAFTGRAREIVASLDPGLPLYWGRSMAETIETGTWVFKIFGSLFSIFGIAALFMAGVGLYGVMAFSVALRTQELAIRMAMGAEGSTVFRLVLSKGMLQLGIGAVLGLGMGGLMARPMALVFFDVDPSDPTVYATILVTMVVAGLLACVVPARRAVGVQLVDALRPD